MKILLYTAPGTIEHLDQPEPENSLDRVMVRVEAVGICGSDMHAYHGQDPRRVPPLILGHEPAGTVVSGKYAGKRVAVNPQIQCGNCEECWHGRGNLCSKRQFLSMQLPGAFAEYISVPEACLFVLKDKTSFEEAALCEPLAVAIHGVHLLEKSTIRPLRESKMLIIGGGAIGLLTALCLRLNGVQEIFVSDRNPLRLKNITSMEGFTALDAGKELPDPSSYNAVVDAVGCAPTRQTALKALKPGGTILHLGLQEASTLFDLRYLTIIEGKVIGSFTYTPSDIQAALAIIESGQTSNFSWIDTRPLSEGPKAFQELDSAQSPYAKIILVPH